MKQLSKYLTAFQLHQISEKGPEFAEKLNKQLSHQLYKDANFMYNQVQLQQLVKAAEKYPNPLNEDDWTNEEMLEHGFQELVDQSHYFMMMKNRMEKLMQQLADKTNEANYWRNKYRAEKYLHEDTKDQTKKK